MDKQGLHISLGDIMNKMTAGFLAAGLIVCLVASVIVAFNISQINALQNQVSDLESQFTSLEQQKSNLTAQVESLENNVTTLENKIVALQAEKSSLIAQIQELQNLRTNIPHGFNILSNNTFVDSINNFNFVGEFPIQFVRQCKSCQY